MARFSEHEVARVARLARLCVGAEERARVAAELDAITDAFSDLADYAATLPPAEADAPAPAREDDSLVPDEADADLILAAAPRVHSGAVRGPRGAS